ncbi:MAG: ISAs1 family transposase [Timaviella obliquedivisa GSE-PSE-MK23-08B]|nr:ISAs1 family transposase [Timaviella obliquedivisa GSE-PSE-MK23-08B]
MLQSRCPPYSKKTTQQIIASGNDYLITVKGNQQTLFNQLQTQFEQLPPLSVDHQSERTRDRVTHRRVSVLDQIPALDPQWMGIQRIVRVERTGTRAGKPYDETMFYISSLRLDAAGFAQQIRGHWQIENRLHWVKDVVLKEDESPLCDGNASVNFGIVRTFGVNLFRLNGFDSITKGLRFLAHDVGKLFSFFQ